MIYCFLQKEIDNNRKIAFMSVIRCRSCLFVLADFIRNDDFSSIKYILSLASQGLIREVLFISIRLFCGFIFLVKKSLKDK